MSPPIQLSSIPTLSKLYRSSQLDPTPAPASGGSPLPTPSSTLNSKISLIRTSITNLATTSIVNAANTSLLGGGGVDGAIHAAAGPSLLTECRSLNGCPTGSAKLTSAHALPSSYIIHAVGPVYARAKREREGLQAELLRSCYRTSLDLAAGKEEDGSVAFSCLSTGVYGYPSGEAAEVAAGEVRRWLEEREAAGEGGLERVIFCCFEEKDEKAYREWLPKTFPPTEEELAARDSAEAADGESMNADGATSKEDAKPNEPQAASLREDSADIDKDWQAVEKPSAASSEKMTDISEEGEKIEAVNLAEEEGVEVETPAERGVDQDRKVEDKLLKDW